MLAALDAMGGDNAPSEMVKGAVMYVKGHDSSVALLGKKELLDKELSKYRDVPDRIRIIDSTDTIENDDIPTKAIKRKKDSSLVKGLEMVKSNEADAFISAGNTGALLTGAILKVGRIKGIARPALTPIMPTDKGCAILVDAGANTNCKPENLLQFGIMGSAYMKKIMNINNPSVGLVNVGSEKSKGNDIVKKAYDLLKEGPVNFYGNIEAREIPKGTVDVVVCDGFVGNIILKLTEGVGQVMYKNIKEIFTKNVLTYLSALMVKDNLKSFKKKFDYEEYGGSPFLGINGVIIKSHGSAKAKSIYYSLLQAQKFAENGVIDEIKSHIEAIINN